MKYLAIVWGLCLLATILLIWRYYWRLQLTFNTSILSTETPDSFTISDPERKRIWKFRTTQGKREMRNATVTIVGMVRDVGNSLKEIRSKVEKLGGRFREYRVLIVENDSVDNTRKQLLNWSQENPRVTILGCGVNAETCSMSLPKTEGHSVHRTRIAKMVHLRNIYLDYFRQHPFGDYLIVWDLDAKASIYHDGVANSLGYLIEHPDISAVCAWGIYRWGILPLFYDTYALLDRNETFDIEDKWKHDLRKGFRSLYYSRGDEPIEVDSCFSGFAIYRTSAVHTPGVKYSLTPPPNLECEHVSFSKSLPGRKVLNPSMIHLILKNE